jgi:lysophospholipase L1-like esterase
MMHKVESIVLLLDRGDMGSSINKSICLIGLVAFFLTACQTTTSRLTRESAIPTYALTYATIGASDAWGVGTSDPDRLGWPTVLASKLSPSTHLINLGIPQATAADALRDEVPIAVAVQPDIITIWLGPNDLEQHVSPGTFSAQVRRILDDLHAQTKARIYIGNVPDLLLLPFFAHADPKQLRSDVAGFNAAIVSAAAADGAQVVDIAAAFAEVSSELDLVSNDGLHPSDEGARLLADTFASAIKRS